MRHALDAGGKRLRPVLCLAAAQSINPKVDARRAAVALECVNTYSLIHDDLPCMDDADLRRGKPTVHKAFDQATAVLAGDALLAFAFELTAGYSPEIARDLTAVLAHAAGPSKLVGGQMDDTLGQSEEATIERLEYIQRGKTAAMIAASLEMGAIVGGGDAKVRQHFRTAGESLGQAFQIADDLLDLNGDAAVLGKPTGADAAKGKLTYHGILGVDAARQKITSLTDSCIASLDATGMRVEFLKALARSLVERKN
jgi:geranylgeranyl pyrophosphate synthase